MRGRVALAMLGGVSACGRLGFDTTKSLTGTGDGGADGSDASGATCTPWGTPTFIPELSSPNQDWEPTLSPDRQTLVFAIGSESLYKATRMDQTFSNLEQITSLDVPGDADVGPAWSPSGTELYFTSDRIAAGEFRLWRSTFDGSTFAPPTQVAEFATSTDVFSPTVGSDDLEMYFSSIATGDHQLMRAVRASPGDPWMLDGLQSQLTLNGTTGWPSMSYDGLTLYYELKSGSTSDIYVATRTSRSELFDSPTIVSELATGVNGDPDISRDGTELYFSADPVATDTLFDMYVTRRTCEGGGT